jgi:hypothetical protein
MIGKIVGTFYGLVQRLPVNLVELAKMTEGVL